MGLRILSKLHEQLQHHPLRRARDTNPDKLGCLVRAKSLLHNLAIDERHYSLTLLR